MDKVIKKEKKIMDKGMDHLIKMDKKQDRKMDKLELEKKHSKKR